MRKSEVGWKYLLPVEEFWRIVRLLRDHRDLQHRDLIVYDLYTGYDEGNGEIVIRRFRLKLKENKSELSFETKARKGSGWQTQGAKLDDLSEIPEVVDRAMLEEDVKLLANNIKKKREPVESYSMLRELLSESALGEVMKVRRRYLHREMGELRADFTLFVKGEYARILPIIEIVGKDEASAYELDQFLSDYLPGMAKRYEGKNVEILRDMSGGHYVEYVETSPNQKYTLSYIEGRNSACAVYQLFGKEELLTQLMYVDLVALLKARKGKWKLLDKKEVAKKAAKTAIKLLFRMLL